MFFFYFIKTELRILNIRKIMKIQLRNIILFTLCLGMISACKSYDSETCQDISMRAFKGSPQAANEFQKHCTGEEIEIKITHEMCRNALNDLIMSGRLDLVQERYPEGIVDCFTQNDLVKFQKRPRN